MAASYPAWVRVCSRSLVDMAHCRNNSSPPHPFIHSRHVEIRSLEQPRQPSCTRSLATTTPFESGLKSAPRPTTRAWRTSTTLPPHVLAESRFLDKCVYFQPLQLHEGAESTGSWDQACSYCSGPAGYPGSVGCAGGDFGGAVEGGYGSGDR